MAMPGMSGRMFADRGRTTTPAHWGWVTPTPFRGNRGRDDRPQEADGQMGRWADGQMGRLWPEVGK